MNQVRKSPRNGRARGTFEPRPWYGREDAKRNLGAICRAVCGSGKGVGVAGAEERPGLMVENLGAFAAAERRKLVRIGIDEATKRWSDVYSAAAYCGVGFLVCEQKTPRAVLHRVRRPRASDFVDQYRRNIGVAKVRNYEEAIDGIGDGMDALDGNLRKFSRRLRSLTDAVGTLSDGLRHVDGRMRSIWRASGGLPPLPPLILPPTKES